MPIGEPLPIHGVLGELLASLERARAAVLVAPPGAGKTTGVPLALLEATWRGDDRIIVAEPRRVATRMAAQRLASQLGERVGETIGYRTRDDTVVGPRTRVEVITDGILIRMLQGDPSLDGVAAVVLDEFHERHLDSDLSMALTVESMRLLRPDLRLLVMSATLDTGAVVRCLERTLQGPVPLVSSTGRAFPVSIAYAPPAPGTVVERAVADAVVAVLAGSGRGAGDNRHGSERSEVSGAVLAFLPGAPELRRAARFIQQRLNVPVQLLHGSLSAREQDQIVKGARSRRVILATAVAQTSITIEGVTTVIDAGWSRLARYDPNSGMTRLTTERVSAANADQRAGRAGRLGPGGCVRLWSASERLREHDEPEIRTADLAGLALELARFGAEDPSDLAFVDAPDPQGQRAARELLIRLVALDRDGRITPHGIALVDMPVHPRLAHVLLRGGASTTAARIAAILQEGDPMRGHGADIRARIAALESVRTDLDMDPAVTQRVQRTAIRLERLARPKRSVAPRLSASVNPAEPSVGELLALAYPDRLAVRDGSQYVFEAGVRARLPDGDPLSGANAIIVADLDGDRRAGRIWLAAPIELEAIQRHFPVTTHIDVEAGPWSPDRPLTLRARRRLRVGALVVDDRPETDTSKVPLSEIRTAARHAMRQHGLAVLGDLDAWRSLQARLGFLRRIDPDGHWPEASDDTVIASIDIWAGDGTLALPFGERPVERLVAFYGNHRLERMAPRMIRLGSRERSVEYGDGTDSPRVRVRLQHLLGVIDHPRVAGDRIPVVIELLSPADRPIATTADLPGFWRTGYPAVRRDLRGRCPKHHWPDDPTSAPASR